MLAGRTHESTLRSSVRTVVTRFPSPAEIRQEMSLVERAMAGEAIATPSGSQVSKPK
jgi:hypothetical protein